jgi:hypothetical protein
MSGKVVRKVLDQNRVPVVVGARALSFRGPGEVACVHDTGVVILRLDRNRCEYALPARSLIVISAAELVDAFVKARLSR